MKKIIGIGLVGAAMCVTSAAVALPGDDGCGYIDASEAYVTDDEYVYLESNGIPGLQRDYDYEQEFFNNGCADPDETNPDLVLY